MTSTKEKKLSLILKRDKEDNLLANTGNLVIFKKLKIYHDTTNNKSLKKKEKAKKINPIKDVKEEFIDHSLDSDEDYIKKELNLYVTPISNELSITPLSNNSETTLSDSSYDFVYTPTDSGIDEIISDSKDTSSKTLKIKPPPSINLDKLFCIYSSSYSDYLVDKLNTQDGVDLYNLFYKHTQKEYYDLETINFLDIQDCYMNQSNGRHYFTAKMSIKLKSGKIINKEVFIKNFNLNYEHNDILFDKELEMYKYVDEKDLHQYFPNMYYHGEFVNQKNQKNRFLVLENYGKDLLEIYNKLSEYYNRGKNIRNIINRFKNLIIRSVKIKIKELADNNLLIDDLKLENIILNEKSKNKSIADIKFIDLEYCYYFNSKDSYIAKNKLYNLYTVADNLFNKR